MPRQPETSCTKRAHHHLPNSPNEWRKLTSLAQVHRPQQQATQSVEEKLLVMPAVCLHWVCAFSFEAFKDYRFGFSAPHSFQPEQKLKALILSAKHRVRTARNDCSRGTAPLSVAQKLHTWRKDRNQSWFYQSNRLNQCAHECRRLWKDASLS